MNNKPKNIEFDNFCKKIEEVTNKINLKKVATTKRKGWAKVRDSLVFYKNSWAGAESWSALPRQAVYWLSLMPMALANLNEAMKFLKAPIAIPLDYGSTIAMGCIIAIIAFGILSYSRMGLTRRSYEMSLLQDPGAFYTYLQLEEIDAKVDELEKKMREGAKIEQR